jgi:sugar lactone lactonase YvrE
MLVVSMERQTVVRREPDGTLVDHADLSPLLKGPWDHANDLVVAADGTAYVGSLGFHLVGDAPVEPTPIFRLSPDGVISVASEPLFFPNGASIVGGDTLVIAESFGNRLSAFDIRSDGSLSERRDWYAFGPRPEATDWREAMKHIAVAADGTSGPDTEGGIWVADFVRDRAVRIRPDRGIVDEVTVSGDLACYAVALGGADGRTLFLCATPAEFDPQIRRANPLSTIQSCRVAVPAADASVAS